MNTSFKKSLPWGAVLLSIVLLAWLLKPILMPFIIAAALAYLLLPLCRFLQHYRVPAALAALVVEIGAVCVVLALIFLLVPVVLQELAAAQERIPRLAVTLQNQLQPWLQRWGIVAQVDADAIRAFMLKYWHANSEGLITSLLQSVRIGGSVALTLVGNLVLVPVALFYMLVDAPKIQSTLGAVIPLRWKASVTSFLTDCDAMLGQYLRGQMAVMLVLAVFYSVALWLFGLEMALPIGVFTGLAIFVPYLGFGLGLILALLAGLLQLGLPHTLLMIIVVYGAGQCIESFWLTPKWVGERIGLSPLAVIVALLAFGHLFGLIGVLVALPVSAVMVVAIRRLRQWYWGSRLYQGE
jgi:predicted PurR-regulated permease PerM